MELKKRYKKPMEFSKKLIISIVAFSFVMIVWSYILLSQGKEIPAEVIIAWISGILAEAVAYGLKAFFGKKEEENMKFERDKLGMEDTDELHSNF